MPIILLLLASSIASGQTPTPIRAFVQKNCIACHNAKVKQGNLDLSATPFDLSIPQLAETWIKIHDRVRDLEMPPPPISGLSSADRSAFLSAVAKPLFAAGRAKAQSSGRSTWRRMNRYEYENTLRDLLGAPWLQIKDMLPEDGEAYRFNKVGEALDVSHIQMNRYLAAADYALREVLPKGMQRPEPTITRYYAREQPPFARNVNFPATPERNTFPVLGDQADLPALKKKAPMTVGEASPAQRELEGMGVVASTYEPLEIRFTRFKAPVAGRYKLRLNAHTMWVGPEPPPTKPDPRGHRWWKPNPEDISTGRTHEPVTLYSEIPPRQMRLLGSFDVHPQAKVNELDVYLLAGETIRPDATRFFRSRPPGSWRNPLATPEGQPGVVFRWLEVEGPIVESWPTAGHRLLFGNLSYRLSEKGQVEFQSANAAADTRKLLSSFLARAYRRPTSTADLERFAQLVTKAMKAGYSFTDSMISAYSAILCSPAFVTMEEKPGPLDSYALASRLSYFLWNSEPDALLRQLAAQNKLQNSDVLRTQTARLLGDARSQRFVSAFLDYWLDLRKLNNTAPDATLYPDYYLDDFLIESSGAETRAFFSELLTANLPARNIVSSDFAMLNGRLAAHYGIPGIAGAAIRRVALPPASPRGGLLTHASVLKVTANGTTTSPVLRGVWIAERIIGQKIPPPPAAVPAVEPDTRGATTIREQLAKHRSQTVCNSCHAKIDPAGFALENFDVAGAWRERYRALGSAERELGIGKGGQPFEFHYALPVDASGVLPDGRGFADVRQLKQFLLADERQIARNLASQLVTYATGAPIRFSDRPALEAILDRAKNSQYAVGDLLQAIVQSELFRSK